uniref:Uncharacterized protein n=1 Tax=Rhizophora mucronata TaxID=61149 RepID=A0A2P2R3X7_RHIMU
MDVVVVGTSHSFGAIKLDVFGLQFSLFNMKTPFSVIFLSLLLVSVL